MGLVEAGREHVGRVLVDAGEDLGVHPRHALRRVPDALARGVLPQRLDDGGDRLLDLLLVDHRCSVVVYVAVGSIAVV